MLLTGFNAPFLNTLYVDRNLTYHRLIQAFSRTNRVINDTKPYGNILDFRQQQDAVSDAIALFSGESSPEVVKKIWLVDPAETVIERVLPLYNVGYIAAGTPKSLTFSQN